MQTLELSPSFVLTRDETRGPHPGRHQPPIGSAGPPHDHARPSATGGRRPALTRVMVDGAGAVRLTRREAQVLRLPARRWTDKAIAAALGISPRTARDHGAAVLAKLRVRNRCEATAVANRGLA